jgi:hypothetical protein
MLVGLLALKKCYESTSDNLVSQTITFFVNSVRRDMDSVTPNEYSKEQDTFNTGGGANDSGYQHKKKKKRTTIPVLTDIEDSSKDQQDFFRSHWTDHEINVLFHLIKELNNNNDSTTEKSISMINSIEGLLEYKDSETRTHLRNAVSYS